MRDVKFIEQIHDILDEKHFDNEAIRWIVKNCKEYYDEYKTNITMDVFKIKTNEVKNEILKTTIVDTLRHEIKCYETDVKRAENLLLLVKASTIKGYIVPRKTVAQTTTINILFTSIEPSLLKKEKKLLLKYFLDFSPNNTSE